MTTLSKTSNQKSKKPFFNKKSSVKASGSTSYESKANLTIKAIEELMCSGQFRLRWDAAPCNYVTKRRYSGMNLIAIGLTQAINPELTSRYWLTSKQIKSLDGYILKGSKSTEIVYWFKKQYKTEETDENGEVKEVIETGRLYPKVFNIFNINQTSIKLENDFVPQTPSFTENLSLLKLLMKKTGVKFSEGGNSAHYSPLRHEITMPFYEHFVGETIELKEQFYLTTLAHELAHSTMEKQRPTHYHQMINRNVFEPPSKALYAKEEVVAELTASMLCATLRIEKQTLPDHAGYIRGWLDQAKKESPNYFVTACRLATEAHDYLMSLIDSDYVICSTDEQCDSEVLKH